MNCVHVTCNGNNLWGIYEACGGVEENGKEEPSQFSHRTKRGSDVRKPLRTQQSTTTAAAPLDVLMNALAFQFLDVTAVALKSSAVWSRPVEQLQCPMCSISVYQWRRTISSLSLSYSGPT